MNKPICSNCIMEAELVTGEVIYPHRPDLSKLYFWKCDSCGAFVGTHRNSKAHAPLGTLADAETRRARSAAHAAFDPIWKSKKMSRSKAYKWLADQMGIEVKKCHISWFNSDECRQVIDVCNR